MRGWGEWEERKNGQDRAGFDIIVSGLKMK